MVTATRFKTGSIWTPKTDGSEALYLPLWHPTLAGAGPIISKDSYARSCTITGATWGRYGRTFDGTDDYLQIPDVASLDLTGEMTILVWMKRSATGAIWQEMVNKGANSYAFGFSDNNKLNFTIGTVVEVISTGSAITSTSLYYLVGVTRSGTAGDWTYTFSINAAVDSAVNNASNMSANATDLFIGVSSTLGNDFTGVIGEVWIIPRALTLADRLRKMQETQWRYNS